ncbi:MAG TPA: NAD(P)/FAD-dependent oxidoreductase [Dinghuibacter sp.]|uniref:flavin-containing monooxygenase n=1 Tax=Dinghuibacter sp. TaxID=2024697 RepID=UPI002CE859A3|nr:NAD(P)/FAD-dependent oxidoreductase [Dinghuibacter sp.]HTJ12658.1 NAD(P)/FAD-dependent oxidoreductase [Dinghuibacter sp.]
MPSVDIPVIIVGASVSGLASAACLGRLGIGCQVVERSDSIGAPWRHHYDRLHLHTNKRLSRLPYFSFSEGVPRYPSRQQVVDYLDAYALRFKIEPLLGTPVLSVRREDDVWVTETPFRQFVSRAVIMATGPFNKPRPFSCAFTGPVLHSSQYRTGAAYRGQRVLIVGFGNSACEIAIDLYEQGAFPLMSVRSPVNVVPRDILGIPVLEVSRVLSVLPPRVADRISAPLVRLLLGDVSRLGLRRMPYGPLEQIARDGKAPVLDVGVIRLIRQCRIKVLGDILHVAGDTVTFSGGASERVDAIVAAVGYEPDFSIVKERAPGLYFCGYHISPTGQIREIARDARRIAADIASRYSAR